MSGPIDENTAIELARVAGLDLPDACLPGVAENLRLLMQHGAKLDEAEAAP